MAMMAVNLKANTGKTLEQWSSLARKSGKTKDGEVVSWLKANHGITHGYANLIAHSTFRSDAGSQAVGKGLVAGVLIGWFARKVNSLPIGILFGLTVGALFALPFAMGTDPTTGQKYFWEILIPGSMVGLVVGFLTQRYGVRPSTAHA